MATIAKPDLPPRGALVRLAKQIKSRWANNVGNEELRKIRDEIDEREGKLIASDKVLKRLRQLHKQKLESLDRECKAWNNRKERLMQRVQLEPLSPKLVAEVREMLGLDAD